MNPELNPDTRSSHPAESHPEPIPDEGPGITTLAWAYLVLSMAGGIFPWLANWDFIQTYGSGFDLGQFIALANANPASQFLSRDLAVGATAVTIWMVIESRRLKMRGLGWVLLSCVTIAFAFGAPLFLHLRERRLTELQRQGLST
ncbi:MAG: DUF2834 domain-containing protein [Cyanobium sp.]